MSRLEKDFERLLSVPKDYEYSELKTLLIRLGYIEDNKGKTSGSRVRFYRSKNENVIILHIPHPKKILSRATIRDVIEILKNNGDL